MSYLFITIHSYLHELKKPWFAVGAVKLLCNIGRGRGGGGVGGEGRLQ